MIVKHWCLTLWEEHTMKRSENWVLSVTFGPMTQEVAGG